MRGLLLCVGLALCAHINTGPTIPLVLSDNVGPPTLTKDVFVVNSGADEDESFARSYVGPIPAVHSVGGKRLQPLTRPQLSRVTETFRLGVGRLLGWPRRLRPKVAVWLHPSRGSIARVLPDQVRLDLLASLKPLGAGEPGKRNVGPFVGATYLRGFAQRGPGSIGGILGVLRDVRLGGCDKRGLPARFDGVLALQVQDIGLSLEDPELQGGNEENAKGNNDFGRGPTHKIRPDASPPSRTLARRCHGWSSLLAGCVCGCPGFSCLVHCTPMCQGPSRKTTEVPWFSWWRFRARRGGLRSGEGGVGSRDGDGGLVFQRRAAGRPSAGSG